MNCPAWYSLVDSTAERIRAPIERAWRATAQTLLALLVLFSAPAFAQSDAAQTRGLDWLQSQVATDGSLTTEANSVVTAVQARSEVI